MKRTWGALPPGPRMPAAMQTLGVWHRPTAFMDRSRARYGPRFTIRLFGHPPFVMLSDPEEIKQVFLAPPEVLHPGEGARILEPIVGRNSVILLDEAPYMEQRKLLLPAFHGERMQRLGNLISELIAEELARWPRGTPMAFHPAMQRLTLEIMLRAVLGVKHHSQRAELHDLITRMLGYAETPLTMLPPPAGLTNGRGIVGWIGARFGPTALLKRIDELFIHLIEQRRREDTGEEDVLGMLLEARHEDGSPMSQQELRDELLTTIIAGHETTASQLSWAFERLAREPAVLGALREEFERDGDDEYLSAVIYEIMRHKPVLTYAQVAIVKQPIEIGGFPYPPGVALVPNVHLLHHDPAIYPEPYAFRPERFLEEPPGTYTWIGFGGGRRRCLGANFAQRELKLVLRAVIERCELTPVGPRAEGTRRRSITISPAQGGRVILRDRRDPNPRPPGSTLRHISKVV